jgi:hypothetical protein
MGAFASLSLAKLTTPNVIGGGIRNLYQLLPELYRIFFNFVKKLS